MQIYIDRYEPIDEHAQTFGFDGYWRVWWVDPRLAFDPQCSAELLLSREEAQSIWRPDLYFDKQVTLDLPEKTMGITDGKGEMVTVSSDGSVFWSRQARFTLACPMALDWFPFDTQHCNVMAGLYSQRADQVQLLWRDGVDAISNWVGPESCTSGWVPTALAQQNLMQSFSSGNYTYAKATLDFTRMPQHFMWSNFMMSIIMVFISCLGFFIDPTATPARVTLGVISLLVVLQYYIALAGSSARDISTTWLGGFIIGSLMFNLAAFVEQILVNFGLAARKWLETQRAFVTSVQRWDNALKKHRRSLFALFEEWDVDGDGHITKKEFYRGVRKLVPAAPAAEVTLSPHTVP